MPSFKKSKAKTSQEIPTASMPDIVFILLIFFMVTTVLREVKLRVKIDYVHAKNIQKIEQKRLVSYIYIGPEKLAGNKISDNTAIQIDDAIINNKTNIRQIMYDKLKQQPKLIVSLRVDKNAQMGIVTDVKQELRKAGTLRINYSTKPYPKGQM
ncbi:MAG TPA: biopolymer transporter ExbD [Balneolales bacterium]|nr:biopolymer transporter ExbD [Balneolales bacterium]